MDKTFISVKTLAQKMGISEKTVYRMVGDNQIPFAVKIGGQWRFRSDTVESWLNAKSGNRPGSRITNIDITLAESLQNGTVLYRIHGSNRDEALDELLATLTYSSRLDPLQTKVSILARESLCSSSFKGLALMGTSPERPIFFEKTMTLVAFLEKPADFKALDHKKTTAIFLVLPASLAEGALIEGRLRRLAMEPEFHRTMQQQPPRRELLHYLSRKENEIFGSPKTPGRKTKRATAAPSAPAANPV
ncbi:MAG: helix-turn-helix domain-containing protein [Thermodesulfobacteriota bacterium]